MYHTTTRIPLSFADAIAARYARSVPDERALFALCALGYVDPEARR